MTVHEGTNEDDSEVAGYQRTKWWRAVGPDGKTWCESSSEGEVRGHMREGDTLQCLYAKTVYEWRTEQ